MTDEWQKTDRSEPPKCRLQEWLAQIITTQEIDKFWRNFGIKSDSDDLTNIAIFQLDKARNKGQEITKSYIFTTLHNLAIDNCRKSQRESKREKSDENAIKQAPDLKAQKSGDDPRTEVLKKLIQACDLRDRVIINLRYNHDFTYEKIAMVIGFSESSARQECKRIEKALKAASARCRLENSEGI